MDAGDSSCLHAELTVLEELDAAEAARGDWKDKAQHYINAFEKFHGGMKTILERNGGKLFKGYIIRLCLRYGEKTGPILNVCLQNLS